MCGDSRGQVGSLVVGFVVVVVSFSVLSDFRGAPDIYTLSIGASVRSLL